jgi:hypothetical protein
MRSNETIITCPVCQNFISRDNLHCHIAHQARVENKSNLQVEKRHYIYLIQNTRKQKNGSHIWR